MAESFVYGMIYFRSIGKQMRTFFAFMDVVLLQKRWGAGWFNLASIE